MGARQRAQKRGQGTPKAGKGSLKGFPFSQHQSNSLLKVPSLDVDRRGDALLGWQRSSTSATTGTRGMFSMSQEARNTERHVFGWGATKLRDNAITFVSAGHLTQDELQDPPQQRETSSDGHAQISTPETADDLDGLETEDSAVNNLKVLETVESTAYQRNPDKPETPIASQPQVALHPACLSNDVQVNRQRSASASSSSGSEQIVFTGRSIASRHPSRTPSRSADTQMLSEVKAAYLTSTFTATADPVHTSVKEPTDSFSISIEAPSNNQDPRPDQRAHRTRRQPVYISDEEEAIIQDYIANMAMDDYDDDDDEVPVRLAAKPARKNETFRFHHGSGEENAKVQVSRTSLDVPERFSGATSLDQAMDWNSDDLEIFDNMSTSDEDVEDVEQVLRQRERPSGNQYLVTAKGRTVEDAKWILQTRLVSTSAREEIRIFQEIQAMGVEQETLDEDEDEDNEDGSTDEDEEALDDLIGDIESEDAENARIMAHTTGMSDEQIARALAKQQELGMDADEVMLFGDDAQHGDDFDVFTRHDGFIPFSTKQHTSSRTRSRRNQKQRDSFPSAAAFADALDEDPYGGFDVMDFDRPSLRPRKKGRKSGFPYELELEDEELKDQLVSTWVKDREKKATRKREKEEARMAAALDASERSEPAVIKAEIRRFLCQEMDVLRLAPMDSSTRASVHRLAKALRINSRSEGVDNKGKGRYPVLTKTPRTPSYTINTIWEVDALLNTRKFFPKNSGAYKTQRLPRGAGNRSRGTGGIQGASYMNGEVVGASAPELGADNKGRAMLEKMGWTSGMGIGAVGNKGSLEAIKHVVKTTKAGLG